jgi:hypothetical protein
MLELGDVETLVGVEVTDIEGFRKRLLLLKDSANSLATVRTTQA